MSDKNSQTSVTDPLDNATAEFNLTVAEDGLTVSGSLNADWGYLKALSWIRRQTATQCLPEIAWTATTYG